MNATVGRACARGPPRPGFGSKTVNPLTGGYRLARHFVCSKRSPIAFGFVLLVRDRAFHHEDKGIYFSLGGIVEKAHECFAIFISQHRVVETDSGNSRNNTLQEVLQTRLGG